MRILIVHPEPTYFAGAEKMLGYFVQEWSRSRDAGELTVGLTPGSPTEGGLALPIETLAIAGDRRFSVFKLIRQVAAIVQSQRKRPLDLLHAWAARDWELTALSARILRRPAIGTIHDHPDAPFLSRQRKRLMGWAARSGLEHIVCVSGAVRDACLANGYPPPKLRIVRNGLPERDAAPPRRPAPCPQLGFLGFVGERKGFRGLFQMIDLFASLTDESWELQIAGDAQDEEGRRLLEETQQRYRSRPWWPRVKFLGWLKDPFPFLQSLDLLICPSSDFDPFPTVLLEAGQLGLPVLAADVGGVAEILRDGETGWIFPPRDWHRAATITADLLSNRSRLAEAGDRARRHITSEFTAARMLAGYRQLYSSIVR